MRAMTMVVTILVLLLAVSTQAVAYSDMLGVNISSVGADDISASTSAGYVPQIHWNNAQGGTILTTHVTNNGVNVPGLTANWGPGWGEAWGYPWTYINATDYHDPAQDLQQGLGESGFYFEYTPRMTVGGIPFASYDVAVLTSSFPDNDYWGPSNALQPLTWQLFTGQSGSSYTIFQQQGTIYAMQILSNDTPEPATLSLLALGGIGMLMRRRSLRR